MKLYVWRNVLYIVGDGIIAVMAESENEARNIISSLVDSDKYGASWLEKEINEIPPTEVHEESYAVWCVGSE
jgi:hypothetical protein